MIRAAGFVAVLLQAAAAAGQSSPVTITGGPDESLHNYSWQVTNHHTARIVYIEFPHYRADLFSTPPTWTQKVENVSHFGWKDRPGTCMAEPAPPYTGLPPGGTAQFDMRIAAGGALPGKGSVRVRFEDGTEATIGDVEVPTKPEAGSAYLALVATGVIFVLFIIYNERRRRRRGAGAAAEEEL